MTNTLVRWWRKPTDVQSFSSVAAWRRQHDECSRIIRNTITTLLLLILYCITTLANNPDTILLTPQAEIRLPIANITLQFGTFLTIGPLALLVINLYLHYFYAFGNRLQAPPSESPEEVLKLPYLINLDGIWARLYRLFMLYFFVPLTLVYFAWKASPRDEGLLISGIVVSVSLLFMGIRFWHTRHRKITKRWWIIRILLSLTLSILLGSIVVSKNPLSRGLDLSSVDLTEYKLDSTSLADANLSRGLQNTLFDWANLEDVDMLHANLSNSSFYNTRLQNAQLKFVNLEGANFFSGDIRNVDFFGADLRNVVFHGRDMEGVTLQAANLAGASLTSVKNLSCDQLKWAKNWELSYRDLELACGEGIPEYPNE